MSYRNDRAKILEEREREIKTEFSEELKQDNVNYDDFTINYDIFFTSLLELKHSIITKDSVVSNNLFKTLGDMIKPICDDEDNAYFCRTPQTIAGYIEYYEAYMKQILPYFPELEKDIQEAIEENAKRYSKYLKPDTTIKINTEIPINDQPITINIDIRKELRLPNPSKDTFKKRKENTAEYGRALKYEQKLFRVYLDGLIEHMIRKHPNIFNGSRYKTFENTEIPIHDLEGRGRKDYLVLRDGLFFMIDRVSQKSPALRQYANMFAQDLFINYRFKKVYSYATFSTFLSEADCEDVLYEMVIDSVRDLIPYEWAFSIDATGFSSSLKNDYNFNKHGDGAHTTHDGRTIKEIDWVNLQALAAQTSNLVMIPRIYYKYSSSEQAGIIDMIKEALKEGFHIERLCADKAYAGKEYREELDRLGIDFYCEFPDNVNPPSLHDDSTWARQFRFQKEHLEEFKKIYHSRSTVESVFGAIKKRLGEKISAKTATGYVKEVYCKVIVHNIYGMIHQLFINGIVPSYVNPEDILNAVKSC